MTGLGRCREIAKILIIFGITWELAAGIAGLVILGLVMVQGGTLSPDRLESVVETVGLSGVVIWAIGDARRRRRRRSPKRVATAEEKV